MNQVLSKINTRFDSSEYILELFGEAVQEETVLKEAAIECFTDSIDLIIEKLTLVDRQKILDKLCGKLYDTEQFTYFNEFRTDLVQLFLQIK